MKNKYSKIKIQTMDVGLDICMLTKCFGKSHIVNLENDIQSFEAVMSLINDNILSHVDIKEILLSIHALRDTPKLVANIHIFLKTNERNNITKQRRVISYIKNRITALDFLNALMSTDHQSVADLLLRRIYQNKFGEWPLAVSKVQTGNRSVMHVLVKKLKQIIDSKKMRNPLREVRRIAIEYKNQLLKEGDTRRKQQLADKYLGVIAVEIDSVAFSLESYASIQALLSEFQRFTNESSSPLIYEGLLHIRMASYYSTCGEIEAAKILVSKAIFLTENIASCPELTNIWYETLNVHLCELEIFPVRENRKKVIETGYTGIQTTTKLEFDIQQFWIPCFLIRMAFACLGLGIQGNVIKGLVVNAEDIALAEILLAGVKENELAMRRKMFYNVAMGRLYQFKSDWSKAARHIQTANNLAVGLGFKEAKHILGCVNEQFQSEMSIEFGTQ